MKVKIQHSQSKSAWNIVGTEPGGKYKIARVPYVTTGDQEIDTRNRLEALEHANIMVGAFDAKEQESKEIGKLKDRVYVLEDFIKEVIETADRYTNGGWDSYAALQKFGFNGKQLFK